MKTIIRILITLQIILLSYSCSERINDPAEETASDSYLSIDDVVNSADFLLPPPDSGSAVWQVDLERYLAGKEQRASMRGQQAISDAYVETDSLAETFSEAFGYEISPITTPAVYNIIDKVKEDAGDLATRHAKQHYMRRRPFAVFGEHTPLLEQEEELRNNGSYPSGHSSIGYAVALVLSEINPQRARQLMQRGYDFGESRVILGFHFDSDVRAGRTCASMLIPILHANEEFQHDMASAKREISALPMQE